MARYDIDLAYDIQQPPHKKKRHRKTPKLTPNTSSGASIQRHSHEVIRTHAKRKHYTKKASSSSIYPPGKAVTY